MCTWVGMLSVSVEASSMLCLASLCIVYPVVGGVLVLLAVCICMMTVVALILCIVVVVVVVVVVLCRVWFALVCVVVWGVCSGV